MQAAVKPVETFPELSQSEGPAAATCRPLRRIVIFTSGLAAYSVRKGIADLVRMLPDVEWLVCEQRPQRTLPKLLRSQWRNVKKNGLRWVTYQASDLAARVVHEMRREIPRVGRCPGEEYEASRLLMNPRLRCSRVTDLHSAPVLDEIRAFAPDLGISLAAPILKPALFDIPRLGTINLHKGKLPHYRGMPPAFWEFVNGEMEVGCSIHRVERGLDTGPVVARGVVKRPAHATVRGVQLALDELGVRLTCDAVRMLADGSAQWETQEAGGKTYTKPTLKQHAAIVRRFCVAGTDSRVRRMFKDVAFWTYEVARLPARHYLALRNRQRIVVLLYHRVSDELRDSLTVGIEQFDAQMEWLGSRYPVADVTDIVRGKVPRDTIRPVIAVTFDDGYLDNFENAVPILQRHRIPAAFFVSTGLIGRPEGFAHDWKRLGHAVPTMNWDQLRQMRSLGFTIGSHTVTHLDCGAADVERVRSELIDSRDALRRELGLDEVIFAYPFGAKANINDAVVQMVKELGFAGCLSAYGGFVGGPIDPFNIERIGIQCNFSMRAFRARLQGYR